MQNIKRKQESIELLNTANQKHVEIIEQLTKAVKTLEKDIVSPMPIEKESTDIITEVG